MGALVSSLRGKPRRKKSKKEPFDPSKPVLPHPILAPFPDPSFVIPIIAKRNSGKTTLLIQMMADPRIYKGIFDRVYLWSPNVLYDPKYRVLDLHPGKDAFEEFDLEHVEKLWEKKNSPKYREEQWLFIFDDCMNEEDFKSFSNYDHPLDRMANIGRNRCVSLIIIVQKRSGVSLNILEQSDLIITFKPFNYKAKRALYDVMGLGTERQWSEVLDFYLVEKYKTFAMSTKPKDSQRVHSWYYDFRNIDSDLESAGLLPRLQESLPTKQPQVDGQNVPLLQIQEGEASSLGPPRVGPY
jgi:hypothetical protein